MTRLALLLVPVVLLGAAAVSPATAGGTAPSCAIPDGTVVSITTGDDPTATSAGVEVSGQARVTDAHEFTGWFEYRVAGAGGWQATNRTTVETNACGQGWFEATLTGLARDGTYEYRVVVSTPNDTARGNVSTFATGPDGRLVTTTGTDTATRPATTPTTDTTTHTATPGPCPNYRGAMALCTTTPTPQDDVGPTPDDEVPPTGDDVSTSRTSDDVRAVPPARDPGTGAWLAGFLPVLAWVAGVVVLAPLVLGGLVGLDSLRGEQ